MIFGFLSGEGMGGMINSEREGMIMKKRWLRWLVCIVLLLPLTTATVRADCAPKPSVNVDVICGRNVIVTLLADREGYGPNYTIAPGEEPGQWLDYNSEPERRAWERFRDYQDPDGFRFWGWMEWHGCSDTVRERISG